MTIFNDYFGGLDNLMTIEKGREGDFRQLTEPGDSILVHSFHSLPDVQRL